MSYNGIGLKSAKGSATSGHIQRSLADNNVDKNKNYHARQKAKESLNKVGKGKGDFPKLEALKKKNSHLDSRKNILNHLSKRDIEVRVSELRDELEDSEEREELINKKCAEFRQQLLDDWNSRQRLENVYRSRAERETNELDKSDVTKEIS